MEKFARGAPENKEMDKGETDKRRVEIIKNVINLGAEEIEKLITDSSIILAIKDSHISTYQHQILESASVCQFLQLVNAFLLKRFHFSSDKT